MKINNCIDLYDYYIVSVLEKRLRNDNIENLKFLYSPINLCFYFAKEKFGDKILPFYNIWRDSPPVLTTDASSLVNYNTRIVVNDEMSINFLLLNFSYNIDFFSDNMYDMNECVMDYYRVRSTPYIEVNLNDIGLDVNYIAEAQLEEITANNNIDEMFGKGRYFRYTYTLNTRLILLRKLDNILLEKINIKFIEYDISNVVGEVKWEL